MTKVAIYCRVSTEDQNVKQQADYLKDWSSRNGYEVVKTVMDEESATLNLVDRKRFRKLLEESKITNSYQAILVFNIDRLTRNWDDVTLIEKHFRENWSKCKLLSVSDSIDLSNASGRAMFRIKMVFNCYMPEDMKEKQRIGIDRAKREGKYKYGRGRPKPLDPPLFVSDNS
jgi:DNA invertase Pin-like site-specific DNA recombinase